MAQIGQIVGWRLAEDDKIILSIVSEDGPEMDVELPLEIYKEIVVEGPPSEEKVVREIIDKIHTVIKKRVLTYDEVIGELKKNRDKINEGLSGLKASTTKLEISKWKAFLDGVGKDKGALQEYRHLIKALSMMETKLRVELLRKLKG